MEGEKKGVDKITVIEGDGTVKTYEGDNYVLVAAKLDALNGERGSSINGVVCVGGDIRERVTFYVAVLYELQKLEAKDSILRIVREGFHEGVFEKDLLKVLEMPNPEVAECSKN